MSDRIDIDCDACDRVFPADPAEQRVACPYCGDVNRIERAMEPEPNPASSGPSAHSNASPPAASSETLLRTVRPALVRGHPVASFSATLLLLGGLAVIVLALTGGLPEWLKWVGAGADMANVGLTIDLRLMSGRSRLKLIELCD